MKRRFEFDNDGEAQAFIEGIEYVNDGAVAVVGVEKRGDKRIVVLEDEDEQE